MEWLKTILSAAKVTDGKIDIGDIMKSVSAEFPKHAVPKQDYNDKVKELNKATETIKDLEKSNGENEDLQNTIKDYEKEIGNLKTERESRDKEYALKESLREKGCTEPEYIIYKHGGVEKFTFDKDSKPVGVDEIVNSYKESTPHVFDQRQKQKYTPAGGEKGSTVNPFAKDTFNLTEQGKILKENPAQARELATAAGITI